MEACSVKDKLNKKNRYLWIVTVEKTVGKSWLTRRTFHSAPDEVKLDYSLKALIITWIPDMKQNSFGGDIEAWKSLKRLTKSKIARYSHWWYKQKFTNFREAVIDRKSAWNCILQTMNSQKWLNKWKPKTRTKIDKVDISVAAFTIFNNNCMCHSTC